MKKVDAAYVRVWDMLVGAVAWDPDRQFASFEFEPSFLQKGLDLAPLRMPVAEGARASSIFSFPDLPRETFRGLPGMLADALPDRFGNRLIDVWLARQGRSPESFSPVERLCYTGKRAMGALEFEPVLNKAMEQSTLVEVEELVRLAREVAATRTKIKETLAPDPAESLLNILRVGTSAGGARPKVVVAINDDASEIRSGQVDAPEGFDHWILKLDGISDESLGDPAGYGRIEYAYHNMALAAGIEMTECRLLEENGRAHFLTRRFDRLPNGEKLHMQSLCAVAHYDFNAPGAYSYEQSFQVMRELRLPHEDAIQQFRRMVFNVAARNQDDHTKNIAFLMDASGRWRLSPAYDVIYAHNPSGAWTGRHQMSINGKRDHFSKEDLKEVGRQINIKGPDVIIDEILDAVSNWPGFARDAGVPPSRITSIGASHRLFRSEDKK